MEKKITPRWHRQQINAYAKEYRHYKAYASALERVLSKACEAAVPGRIVQARPKGMSSFAEKCVRKFDKYKNPANELTDLCGARVIVQTLEQVKAAKQFIEHNFRIVERDDKSELLGPDKFGYRDMHYLVQLKAARAALIGFTRAEIRKIGKRVAEIQVRSIVQHAWADILHDRMYKTPLKLSAEANRTGALLAAIMEDGDRSFDRLAVDLDGMVANYMAYAPRERVQGEISALELILANERKKKTAVALQLVRCLGPIGNYERIVEVLNPLVGQEVDLGGEVHLEFGHALCRVHRDHPKSRQFRIGQRLLAKVVEDCERKDFLVVPDLRRRKSIHARALSRLAWTWEVADNSSEALERYRQALAIEPFNPYHLANQLGFEIYCHRQSRGSIIETMRTQIRQAIEICRDHALTGTELPYAFLTAGRLSLLLGQGGNALGWYARGMRYLFDGHSCVPRDVLLDELQWVERLHFGEVQPPREHDWVNRLVRLGQAFARASASDRSPGKAGPDSDQRTLIIAGGAASMTKAVLRRVKPALARALASFRGKVISGGTKSGIPGCVGEVADALRKTGAMNFELVAYRPAKLPDHAPKDDRYDRHVILDGEDDFSPGQVLRMWEDLLKANVSPRQVMLLGFGGGAGAALEYRVAFALGASVAIVQESGGAASAILEDSIWTGESSLIALPFDEASIQAFATIPTQTFPRKIVEQMAEEFHVRYIQSRAGSLPENVRPWPKLPRTYQTANREQARYAIEILRASGFEVRPARGQPRIFRKFTTKDIKRMAELEHGRWNVERLRDGWRPGASRDDRKKIHNSIVPWKALPATIREYDYNSVKAFPEILAQAGLEVFRRR